MLDVTAREKNRSSSSVRFVSAFVVELLLQASSQLKRIFLEQAQNKLALILR